MVVFEPGTSLNSARQAEQSLQGRTKTFIVIIKL